ncbi:hypothetical protein MHF_0665 [Mycoplasma haemofelis Ohio2]|uniref:Uncharacterized protein n=1 Tax=Mycoplasma haemofelis (strain Ohio2) TaxID=859194 RepID=F6FI89_MYCHI|nr:hypothetical protein MHF_0665 [Mycoplasma haemofelis Ohio2]
MSGYQHNWLSLNLKASLLVGIAGLASVGAGSGVIFGGGSQDIRNSFSTVADPIVNPIRTGYENISSKVKELQSHGYNTGIDFKEWVDKNLSKSRIKTGWKSIETNIKSWGTQAYDISKTVVEKTGSFFSNWESNKELLYTIFTALGGSFSLVGSLFGTWDTSGESKLLLLREVLQKEEFPQFLTHVSALTSKNPQLLSELKGDDIPDVLNAFRQDPSYVNETLSSLSSEEKVNRDRLMSALKLQSLMGKAQSILGRAKKLLQDSEKNKDEIAKVTKELESTIKELTGLIKSQEQADTEGSPQS